MDNKKKFYWNFSASYSMMKLPREETKKISIKE